MEYTQPAPFSVPSSPELLQFVDQAISLGQSMGVHRLAVVDDGMGIPFRTLAGPSDVLLTPSPGVILYGLWRIGRAPNGLVFHERQMDDPTWRQVDAPDESWPEIPLMAVGTRAKRSTFDRNRHQRLTAMRAFLQRSGPPDANLKSGQHTRDPAEAMAEALTPKGKNGAPFFSREERAISQHLWQSGVLDRDIVSLACRVYPQQHIDLNMYLVAERHRGALTHWAHWAPRMMGVLPRIPTAMWGDRDLFSLDRWTAPLCPTLSEGAHNPGFGDPEAARWWLQAPNAVVRHSPNPEVAQVLFEAGLPALPDAAQAMMSRLVAQMETRNRFGLMDSPGTPFSHSEAAALKWVAALLPDAAAITPEYASLAQAASRRPFHEQVFQVYAAAVCKTKEIGAAALSSAQLWEVLGPEHEWSRAIAALRLQRALDGALATPVSTPCLRRRRM